MLQTQEIIFLVVIDFSVTSVLLHLFLQGRDILSGQAHRPIKVLDPDRMAGCPTPLVLHHTLTGDRVAVGDRHHMFSPGTTGGFTRRVVPPWIVSGQYAHYDR